MRRWLCFGVCVFCGLLAAASAQVGEGPPAAFLAGFAKLGARTLAPGPVSGQFAQSANGVALPLRGQPVQGISSVLRERDGTLLCLSDNGYGAKANSADYPLRIYRLRPDWKTRFRGAGSVAVEGYISLRDPDRKIGFPVVADGQNYPNSKIKVDEAIRRERLLTGADVDVESFRKMPDGSFWLGEEFGPFLLHVDAAGKVLEPAVRVPNPFPNAGAFVQSPDSPLLNGATPNLPPSGGFEGMALMPDGKTLLCLLEKGVDGDPEGKQRLLILRFDTGARRFAPEPIGYRKEREEHNIGEMTALNERELLVIERDNEQGQKAQFKRIYKINIADLDGRGFAKKTLVVDLMNIADPANLSGVGGGRYAMPFLTIESVAVVNPSTLLVVHDNNFPGSNGRAAGQPEDTEFAQIALPEPLFLR